MTGTAQLEPKASLRLVLVLGTMESLMQMTKLCVWREMTYVSGNGKILIDLSSLNIGEQMVSHGTLMSLSRSPTTVKISSVLVTWMRSWDRTRS